MGRRLRAGTIPMSSTSTSTSNSLSDAQREVLTAGAARADRMLLPLPATIRVRGGARRNLLAALLKLDLVAEVQAAEPASAWRSDEADRPIGLRLTGAGLAAVGAAPAAPEASLNDAGNAMAVDSQTAADTSSQDDAGAMEGLRENVATDQHRGTTAPRRPTGKLGQVLEAISAETGATLSEVTTLTGWLPHTARAAVTGLRQRGFPIALIQQDGRKAYRLTEAG